MNWFGDAFIEEDTQEFAVGDEAGHGRSEPEAVSPMVPSVAGAGFGLYAAIAAARRARRERALGACIADGWAYVVLSTFRRRHLFTSTTYTAHSVQLARLLVEPQEAHRQAHSLLPRRTHLM